MPQYEFYYILFTRDRLGAPSGAEKKIHIFDATDDGAAVKLAQRFCERALPKSDTGHTFHRDFVKGTLRPRQNLVLGAPLPDPISAKAA